MTQVRSVTRELTVGQLAARSGATVSAAHFYEAKRLIWARRTAGSQRRCPRAMLRRVAFIRASQRVGIRCPRSRKPWTRRRPPDADSAGLGPPVRGLVP
jgi:MerR family transcriptional regulator, redox-sensitive transcriptional activator SoxR